MSLTYKQFTKQYPSGPRKPIYIFIHICNIGSWRTIFDEMITELIQSRLYNTCERIFIGCSCPNCENDIKDASMSFNKLTVLPAFDHSTHENGTINHIINFSKQNDGFILYMHSKGVTNKTPRQHYWRKLMMFYNVTLWRVCVGMLCSGMHTVGHQHATMCFLPPHYSGNFWWANTLYLRNIPLIKNVRNRYNAEFFLLQKSQKGKHASIGSESWFTFPYPFGVGLYSRGLSPPLPSLQSTNIDDLNIDIY